MILFSLNFLIGIMVFSSKKTLEISTLELSIIFAILLAIFYTFRRHKSLSLNLMILLLGFSWMGIFSTHTLESKIDDIYLSKPIKVIGKIANLPESSNSKAKFILSVEQPFVGNVKLSWFDKNLPLLNSNDTWQLWVKLKQNNGFQNTSGFDYEQWLFYQNIDATGYVRKNPDNQLIQNSNSFTINTIRQDLGNQLSTYLSSLSFGGVINALIIGDRSLITDKHWLLFKQTNTTHLSVISGLHIGLISGFVFIVVSFLFRQCTACLIRVPAMVVGAYFGIIAAFAYAVIAGLSIPTQRAFVMASVVFLSIIYRRHHNTWQLFSIALLLVLVLNPLSVYSIGFWLSFYVVAVIIYGISHHQKRHWLFRVIYLQLLISIATMPLIAWFFTSGSLLSPIANLVAIPVFSFITTPLSLLGAIFATLNIDSLANICFMVANQSLESLSIFLNAIQQFDFNQWHYSQNDITTFALLMTGVIITILPSSLKFRTLGLIVILSALFGTSHSIKKGDVVITTLDVGQGLSQVVRTKNHTLLFDTGASYPSGFNLGDAVVTPYLRANQISNLDLVVISHGDNDHIGGLSSIVDYFSIEKIVSSVPNKIKQPSSTCKSHPPWRWDGVTFEFLSTTNDFQGNNASCVLKISNDKFSILLTGDIEKQAEKDLIKTWGNELNIDVLISPHHGSKTSSSAKFLKVTSPSWVVVSNGYQNRFKHPAKTILDRYKKHDIDIIKTSCSGQVDIYLSDDILIKNYREEHARYYIRQCND